MAHAMAVDERAPGPTLHPLRRALLIAAGPLPLSLALAGLCLLALGVGAVPIAPREALGILAQTLGLDLGAAFEARQATALLALRLPRVILAVAVGATLALSGAALQGIFRNPLADPQLLGISTGGALGAAGVILIGGALGPGILGGLGAVAVPLGAFVGSLLMVLAVLGIANKGGRAQTERILLAGIALNAMGGAGLGMLLFFANESGLRSITLWTLGSLGGATWSGLWVTLPLMGVAAWICLREGPALNALLLGETEAGHLGLDVPRLEWRLTLAVALAVGAGVSLTGVIGFVGLVVPHLYRLAVGPDHRRLLPGSALLGACLLVGADIAARRLLPPQELPIGVLTALMGAPFFLWLLRQGRGARI